MLADVAGRAGSAAARATNPIAATVLRAHCTGPCGLLSAFNMPVSDSANRPDRDMGHPDEVCRECSKLATDSDHNDPDETSVAGQQLLLTTADDSNRASRRLLRAQACTLPDLGPMAPLDIMVQLIRIRSIYRPCGSRQLTPDADINSRRRPKRWAPDCGACTRGQRSPRNTPDGYGIQEVWGSNPYSSTQVRSSFRTANR